MSEKRDDDERKPLYAMERPRAVRHNVFSLIGLFLIFIAATVYGSYFYGIPGHAVRSRAEVILAENPLIDGHNDLLIFVRGQKLRINDDNFTKPFENGGFAGHVDIPRLKQGQQGGAFWSKSSKGFCDVG
jgi:membrane dipeptidase